MPKQKDIQSPQTENQAEEEPQEESVSYSEEQNKKPPVRILSEEELPTEKSIVQVKSFSAPIVNVEQAEEAFTQYQKLISALVTQKDVQIIQGKTVAKKVGINKLARFFGVSVEVIKEKQETYTGPKGGTILVCKVWVKATLPNGQFRVAGGACSSSERRFAHLYADVFATAETRATKRAIEGLIGMGEIELEGDDQPDRNG